MYNSPSPLAVAWSRVSASAATGGYIIRSDVNGLCLDDLPGYVAPLVHRLWR